MASVPLGRYLWERIHQVGVDTIMGVPGDFNMNILDYIYEVPGLRWVGNANELNSSYAADGYARVRQVPGVFVTTHGVGELSALNGVAGAYSEQVKIIHVVGQTTRKMHQDKMMIHHSIDFNPDHQCYNKASTFARVASAEINDLDSAPVEIDRVIRECFIRSLPVYIFIPLDLADEHVSSTRLSTPIDLSLPIDNEIQSAAISAIVRELSNAKNPCILVDALVQRHNAVAETKRLVDKLKIPVFSANIGKGIIDETHPCYVGVYNGAVSHPGVYETLNSSDLVLVLGSLPCDTNTGGFTRKIDNKNGVFINANNVEVLGKKFEGSFIKPLISALAEIVPESNMPAKIPSLPPIKVAKDADARHIAQSWIWHRMAKFLQPNDVVIAETGTATFGLCDTTFPSGIRFIQQTYYGSIGFATACALGTELALQELAGEVPAKYASGSATNGIITNGSAETSSKRGRTVLVTGDGSFLLTMQELSVMIKANTRPIIFLINNAGYTIERVIHGASQPYNDVPSLKYKHMLPLFGHPDPENSYYKCETKEEVEELFSSGRLENKDVLQVVELVMRPKDVPWRLSGVLALRGEKNVKYLKDEGFLD